MFLHIDAFHPTTQPSIVPLCRLALGACNVEGRHARYDMRCCCVKKKRKRKMKSGSVGLIFSYVCERRVNLLVFSLSLHRHSYISFILAFDSSIRNKQTILAKASAMRISIAVYTSPEFQEVQTYCNTLTSFPRIYSSVIFLRGTCGVLFISALSVFPDST
jgi:hypothetical protein